MRSKVENNEIDKYSYIPVRLCTEMDYNANNLLFKTKEFKLMPHVGRLCPNT